MIGSRLCFGQPFIILRALPGIRIYTILVFFGAFFVVFGFLERKQAQEQQSISLWLAANQAYQEQRFLLAASHYEALVAQGHANGHLYYNLGNTYFHLNNPGKAIGYYLKAQHFLPRHEDLVANLNHARRQTLDRRENPKQSWREVFWEWSSPLTLQEWSSMLVMANGVFWIGVLVRLFYRREFFSWLMFLSGGLTLFLLAGLFIKWWAPLPTGTILPEVSAVYSAPHSQSTVLFQLHGGTEVIIEEEVEQWVKIKFEPTQKGWIEKSRLFLVHPAGL